MHLFPYHLWPSSKWLQVHFITWKTGDIFKDLRQELSSSAALHHPPPFQPHQTSRWSLGLVMSACLCTYCSLSLEYPSGSLFYLLNCCSSFRMHLKHQTPRVVRRPLHCSWGSSSSSLLILELFLSTCFSPTCRALWMKTPPFIHLCIPSAEHGAYWVLRNWGVDWKKFFFSYPYYV